MDAFASCRLLLSHARKSIEEFDRVSKAFSPTITWRMGFWTQDDIERKVFSMSPDKPFPPELSLYVFDAVNAARSALDHAAYASAITLGVEQPKRTKFPFGKDVAEARADLARRKAELHPEIIDVMLAWKPFDAGNGGNALLWGLNQIRNTKIHKLLLPSVLDFDTLLVDLPPGSIPASDNGPVWDAQNNWLNVFSMPLDAEPDRIRFRIKFELTLGDVGPMRGRPAVDVLHAISDEVENVIIDLETQTARIRQCGPDKK